jgi:hypothetical protein
MSNITLVVDNVREGTEPMKNKGMEATFTLNVTTGSEVIVSLNKLTIRKSQAGDYYVGQPYDAYKDREGNAKKAFFYYLFPELDRNERNEKLDAIIKQVREQLTGNVQTSNVNTNKNIF